MIKMSPIQDTTMPVLTVCPSYQSSYKTDKLISLGISDANSYRGGDFKGNSTKNEKEIFEEVSFSFAEVIDSVEIVFPMNQNNVSSLRLKSDQIEYKLAKHLSLGKCFVINIKQFDEAIMSVTFLLKIPGYIYVNLKGQFRMSDSYSKVEVKLNQKLYIELIYEIIKQNEEIICKTYTTETYDDCTEGAAEDYMRNTFNCTAPFINSPKHLLICKDPEKSSKVWKSGFLLK